MSKNAETATVILHYTYTTSDGEHGEKTIAYQNQANSKRAMDHAADVTAHALNSGTNLQLSIMLDDGDWLMTTIVQSGHYHVLQHTAADGISHREG